MTNIQILVLHMHALYCSSSNACSFWNAVFTEQLTSSGHRKEVVTN